MICDVNLQTALQTAFVGVETERGEWLCRPSFSFCLTLCFAQTTDRAQVLYFFAPPAAAARSHSPLGAGRSQGLPSAPGQVSREAFFPPSKPRVPARSRAAGLRQSQNSRDPYTALMARGLGSQGSASPAQQPLRRRAPLCLSGSGCIFFFLPEAMKQQ